MEEESALGIGLLGACVELVSLACNELSDDVGEEPSNSISLCEPVWINSWGFFDSKTLFFQF